MLRVHPEPATGEKGGKVRDATRSAYLPPHYSLALQSRPPPCPSEPYPSLLIHLSIYTQGSDLVRFPLDFAYTRSYHIGKAAFQMESTSRYRHAAPCFGQILLLLLLLLLPSLQTRLTSRNRTWTRSNLMWKKTICSAVRWKYSNEAAAFRKGRIKHNDVDGKNPMF